MNGICSNERHVQQISDKCNLKLSVYNVDNNKELVYTYPNKLIGEQLRFPT